MFIFSNLYLRALFIGVLIRISICKDIPVINNKINDNNENDYNDLNSDNNNVASSETDNQQSVVETLNNITWDCANNSTCVKNVARNLIKTYENGDNIDFGLFTIEKLPINDDQSNDKDSKGRSMSTLQRLIEGNAIKIPVGPMTFSLKRSDDEPGYMELALLKKISDSDEGKGLKSIGRRNRKRPSRKEKKHLQILIPLYLAASTFGWTLLAVKAVGVLTIKALLVSKLAFIVAAGIAVKKMMEAAHQKMLYPHHHPYMMPYSMDYGMQAHSMPGAEEYLNLQQYANQQALESMAASESNHVVHTIPANGTQQQQQQLPQQQQTNNINQNGQKIKRSDQWSGLSSRTTSPFYNYLARTSPYVYQ